MFLKVYFFLITCLFQPWNRGEPMGTPSARNEYSFTWKSESYMLEHVLHSTDFSSMLDILGGSKGVLREAPSAFRSPPDSEVSFNDVFFTCWTAEVSFYDVCLTCLIADVLFCDVFF